jgi:predicted esterase
MVRRAAVALLALAWLCRAPVAAEGAGAPSRTVAEAMQRYASARSRIDGELGSAEAAAFQRRLFDDLERQAEPPPEGFSDAEWADTVASTAKLDMDAVDQLAAGTPRAPSLTPGLHELLVPSRIDRTWQLVALYVPATVKASSVPLAIVLHGNPQTESELLGQPSFRRLAERTGTIVAVPWGRGLYDYAEPAGADVYDLLELLQRTLPVDRGRTYLAGYSMGGFSVFKIGPRGGARWAGVLCVSGAVLNSGVRAVSIAWSMTPLYVVTGGHDDSIPTKYGEQTASYLAGIGLPVSFYEEPNGTHRLRTLNPSLQRAWDDMHAGLTRPETVPVARRGFGLPAGAPSLNVWHP